jgi:4-carboxymuconolactone decarboxylase
MAMTAALGRMQEFRLHAGAQWQIGVSDEELDELPFQIAAYRGAPAALAARREIQTLRSERDA